MRPSGKPALAEVWPGCGTRGNRLLAQDSCPEMLLKTARAEGIGRRKRAIPVRPYAGRGLRAQGALKARSLNLAVPPQHPPRFLPDSHDRESLLLRGRYAAGAGIRGRVPEPWEPSCGPC